jgi:hypothetical protein
VARHAGGPGPDQPRAAAARSLRTAPRSHRAGPCGEDPPGADGAHLAAAGGAPARTTRPRRGISLAGTGAVPACSRARCGGRLRGGGRHFCVSGSRTRRYPTWSSAGRSATTLRARVRSSPAARTRAVRRSAGAGHHCRAWCWRSATSASSTRRVRSLSGPPPSTGRWRPLSAPASPTPDESMRSVGMPDRAPRSLTR